jgi:hypothetical protein
MSAKFPRSTVINYAASLRVLNFRDLNTLMDELRISRAQAVRKAFFSGGLEEYNKVRTIGSATVFDGALATDGLADVIAPATKNVTTLIRQTTLPDHLHLWLENMTFLERLQVFSGEVLGDERAHAALEACPNLKSIEIYHWPLVPDSDPDEEFSKLLASMAGKLERLVIKRGSYCFRHLSLSALAHHHGPSLRKLEVQDIDSECLPALGETSQITNLRSCTIHANLSFFFSAGDEVLESISNFFVGNRLLENLDVKLPRSEKILPPVLRALKLKFIALDIPRPINLAAEFWSALASRADSVERFCYSDTDPLVGDSRDLFCAVRLFYKLKSLTTTGDFFSPTDEDLKTIAAHCANLEELSCTTTVLSDDGLLALSKLSNFKTLICRYSVLY